jgi:hypothetical protein
MTRANAIALDYGGYAVTFAVPQLSQRETVFPNQLTSTAGLGLWPAQSGSERRRRADRGQLFPSAVPGRQQQFRLSCALFADKRRTRRGGSGVPPADPPVAGLWHSHGSWSWPVGIGSGAVYRTSPAPLPHHHDRRKRYPPCQHRKEPA